jgi:hypothetical protein
MKLRKPTPIQINAEDPFGDDPLNQQEPIVLLTRLIKSTEQPFVITIEAPWGSGKTKFIERWKAHLEKEKQACLYFNAWENDFVSDPLVAFIGELEPLVRKAEAGDNKKSAVRTGFQKLKELGGALVKKGAPIFVKSAARKLLGSEGMEELAGAISESADDLAEVASKAVEKQIEKYAEEKKGIVSFRETLKQLAEEVTAGPDKPKQLVFFVDELDRCRPDFAMTLLERIKHLFNVEKVVFVLALDREQLRNTVRTIYGVGNQADTYLRRFIDLSFKLPKPRDKTFAYNLFTRFRLNEVFAERSNGPSEQSRLIDAWAETASWLNLDLRTQEQCLTRLNVIARIWHTAQYMPTDALSILVGLRVGAPERFEALRTGKTKISEQLPIVGISMQKFPQLVEATLEIFFGTEEDFQITCNAIRKQRGPSNAAYSPREEFLWHLANHRSELRRLIEILPSGE